MGTASYLFTSSISASKHVAEALQSRLLKPELCLLVLARFTNRIRSRPERMSELPIVSTNMIVDGDYMKTLVPEPKYLDRQHHSRSFANNSHSGVLLGLLLTGLKW